MISVKGNVMTFNLSAALNTHDVQQVVDAANNGDPVAQDYCFLHPALFDRLEDDIREAIILGALRTGRAQVSYAAADLHMTIPKIRTKLLHRLRTADLSDAHIGLSFEEMERRMRSDIRQQHEKSEKLSKENARKRTLVKPAGPPKESMSPMAYGVGQKRMTVDQLVDTLIQHAHYMDDVFKILNERKRKEMETPEERVHEALEDTADISLPAAEAPPGIKTSKPLVPAQPHQNAPHEE
jgi:hypothetical protein